MNDFIEKYSYQGQPITLKYPSVDTPAKWIAMVGKGCLLYKRDISWAFRQIPLCPRDSSLIGWRWRGQLYFDKVMSMGLRSTAYACQKITDALAYIHNQIENFTINYLDDFGLAEPPHLAQASCEAWSKLFAQLGMQEAHYKALPPSTEMGVFRCLIQHN